MAKCLIEGCNENARARGLCNRCYSSAKFTIKAGKTTWDELESLGLALPAQHAGGGVPGAFGKALAKATSEKPAPDPDAAPLAAGGPDPNLPKFTGPVVSERPRTIEQELDHETDPPSAGTKWPGRWEDQGGVRVYVPEPVPAGFYVNDIGFLCEQETAVEKNQQTQMPAQFSALLSACGHAIPELPEAASPPLVATSGNLAQAQTASQPVPPWAKVKSGVDFPPWVQPDSSETCGLRDTLGMTPQYNEPR